MSDLKQQPSAPSLKRKRDASFINVVELPDHIIYSILLNLPVKTLLRFRSVSKNWGQIITSSSFANQQLESVRQSTASCNVIHLSRTLDCNNLSRDLLSCRITSVDYDLKFERPVKLHSGCETGFDCQPFMSIKDLSSCNGLLCVARFGHSVDTANVWIWNPATGKHRRVEWPPLFDNSTRSYLFSFMGFGYDPSTDDHKVVFVVCSTMVLSTNWEVHVLSLKENKWRNVNRPRPSPLLGIDFSHQTSSVAVTVNGDVYWFARQASEEGYFSGLMKFNLAKESFSFLSLPVRTGVMKGRAHRKLATHNGLLYIFIWDTERLSSDPCGPRHGGVTSDIDIWTLQDHTTWCKVATIPTKEYGKPLHPAGFNMSGHVIMVNTLDSSLVVYIPQENRLVELAVSKVDAAVVMGYHFVQMETLVSP